MHQTHFCKKGENRKQKTPMRLRPIQGREALAFCVFMCACGAGFAPGFGFLRRIFSLCAKKRPQNAMICPGPLVYKVQTVYNKKQQNPCRFRPEMQRSGPRRLPPFRKERFP